MDAAEMSWQSSGDVKLDPIINSSGRLVAHCVLVDSTVSRILEPLKSVGSL